MNPKERRLFVAKEVVREGGSKAAAQLLTQEGFMHWAEGKELVLDDLKPDINY